MAGGRRWETDSATPELTGALWDGTVMARLFLSPLFPCPRPWQPFPCLGESSCPVCSPNMSLLGHPSTSEDGTLTSAGQEPHGRAFDGHTKSHFRWRDPWTWWLPGMSPSSSEEGAVGPPLPLSKELHASA